MPSLLLLLSSLAIGGAVFFLVRLIEPLWDRVSDRYVRDVRPMLDALS